MVWSSKRAPGQPAQADKKSLLQHEGLRPWAVTRNRLLLVALVAVVVLVLWPRRRPAARGPLLESDRQGQ